MGEQCGYVGDLSAQSVRPPKLSDDARGDSENAGEGSSLHDDRVRRTLRAQAAQQHST